MGKDEKQQNMQYVTLIMHTHTHTHYVLQDDGRYGDDFMNQIQPIASEIPYMVAPGNHEWLE